MNVIKNSYSSVNIVFKLLLLFLLGVISCSRQETPEVIAKVGEKKIYYDDYDKSFYLDPVYKRGDTWIKARKKQLKLFIDEKLLAYGGEGIEADTSAFFKARMDWYARKTLSEAFLEENVFKKIKISEKELLEGFEKRRKRVRLRHIFFRDSLEAARALKHLLKDSTSFGDYAKIYFKNPKLRENGGDLGVCRYGELDENLENAAFSLKPGEVFPRVVKSQFGYHILKAEEIYIDLLPTKENFAIYKEEIKSVIKTRKMRKLRRKLILELTEKNPVNINLPSFERLAEYARKTISREVDLADNPIIPNVFGEEIRIIGDNLEDHLNDPLVSFGNASWSIGDFLKELKNMPPTERPQIDSEAFLYKSIKYMVLDELMAREALHQGLDDSFEVERTLNNFKDKLSAEIFREKIASRVVVSNSRVDSFFIKRYGKIPEKRQKNVYEYTRNYLAGRKRSELMKRTLDSLKQKHPVVIADSLLLKGIPKPNEKIDYTPTPILRKRLY